MLTGRFRRLKHRAAAGPDARWDVWDLDEKDDKILVAIRIDDALPPVCAAIVVRAPSKRNARANEYGLVSINAAGTSWELAGEKSDGWHGYLDEGHNWRKC